MEEVKQSWWKRNWKWAAPVGGCLSIIIVFIGLIVWGGFAIFDAVKDKTNQDEVLRKAQTNQVLIDAIGEPIETNGFGSHSIRYNNGKKTASATLPIKGPNGTATITIATSGDADNLTYEVLEVKIHDTGQVIDMRESMVLEE